MGDDVLDYQLRQLVSEAQQHPLKSAERRKALNRLIKKIQELGKLKSFTQWQNLPDFEDIYHEAKAKTYVEICNNIDNYRPEHPVMAWVNQILDWRFHDVLRQIKNRLEILSLDELDNFNNSELETSNDESEIVLTINFVQDDPEGILQNVYIGSDTNANLQKILLMRLNEEKWSDISRKLGHPIARLSELYQRNIKKRTIIDYFRKYLH